ncbi:MAG: L,D-transpeptidase family protein [Gemmatimonadota bacterium]
MALCLLAATMVLPTPVAAQGPVGTPVAFAGAAAEAAGPDERPLGWPFASPFASHQLEYPRVKEARLQTRFGIKELYRERGITYPAAELYVRVFKRERVLEVWARPTGGERYELLNQYLVCALEGSLGPKRQEGDGQTPEGFYALDFFNPESDFHLSLHLDYPNRSDRALGHPAGAGGEIFIHGGCQTAGCIAVNDEAIKEIYWLAVEARAGGQERIPVHIFPARLEDYDMEQLHRVFGEQPELLAFWEGLRPAYTHFEESRTLPAIGVLADGRYIVNGVAGALPGAPAAPVEDGPVGRPVGRTAAGGGGV